MAIQEDQVDQIVRAVLARLGSQSSPEPVGAHSPVTELAIDEPVITAAALDKKLTGIRRLVVSPRAVVTPAARDLLKEKNVTLVRSLPAPKAITTRVALAATDTKVGLPEIVRSLERQQTEVEQVTKTQIVEAVKDLTERVATSGKLAVLITSEVTKALCIANRHPGIRAAAASSRSEVQEIVTSIGANFLVVDPSKRSRFELQRIVEAFCLSGPRECPAELKPLLE